MTENKCNKITEYLDHLYCQPEEGENYIRKNNNMIGGGSDILSLLKENKQLKAMLMLHLDLIQEQSDQLITKDKQIFCLKEELQSLRAKSEPFKNTVQGFQCQFKPASAPLEEVAGSSPSPSAKLESKESSCSANIIGECNGKLISKIVLQRINIPKGAVFDTYLQNSTAISDITSEEIIPGKCIDSLASTDLFPRGCKPCPPLTKVTQSNTPSTSTNLMAPATILDTKKMPLMFWHDSNFHSEDSASADEHAFDVDKKQLRNSSIFGESQIENFETTKMKTRIGPQLCRERRKNLLSKNHKRRCIYLTATQMYASREWEDQGDAVCDHEFSRAEAEALHSVAPMLEIPKWIEHDLHPTYCIDGTENLSDDLFLKRHAKFEVDEKRRKKWDVQQIREQRRIEKLRRRHCKNETQNMEPQLLRSFYPEFESIQSISFVSELPVQAFGEMVPKLNTNGHFFLPWLQNEMYLTHTSLTKLPIPPATISKNSMTPTTSTTTTTIPTTSVKVISNSTGSNATTQKQLKMKNSNFIFRKKRKIQQSIAVNVAERHRTPIPSKFIQPTSQDAVLLETHTST